MAAWYRDIEKISRFAKALDNADEFENIGQVLLFLQNASDWNEEFINWEDNDSPMNSSENGWDEWFAFLNERE